ncbi:MAG: dienelactone hydrolase family protein [Alphaproteobacteria bacterium]
MEIKRRDVLRGMVAGSAAAPLAAVLADPKLARAAAEGLETVTIDLPGHGQASAALALPQTTPAAAVLLVHEWWGLNDQIKAVAAEFANQGYVALAVDLYDGNVATTPEAAQTYMGAVDGAKATATLGAWIDWLKAHRAVSGPVGTVGWCFGGGWSLNASLARPVEATVIYYGNVAKSADDLAPLAGPVLGHFAEQDQWINHDMVAGFEAAMDAAGKTYTDHWYSAQHAFANPTSAAYDQEDAATAWERTLAFFREHLA